MMKIKTRTSKDCADLRRGFKVSKADYLRAVEVVLNSRK